MKNYIRTLVFLLVLPFLAAVHVSASVSSLDDLPGTKIGVQIGTTGDTYASEEYEGDEAGTSIERFNKGNDAIQALKQQKVDCVIIDEQPAKAFVEKNSDLKILEEEFTEEEYAICVSKKNTELKEKINTVLAELKEEGILDQIISNYIGDDTKGTCPYESPEGVEYTNGTLVMATNAYFKPYEYYENNKIVGIDADLAQAICDRLGMKLEIDNMEFDSIITAVQSGKADVGIAGMTVTEDRLKNIDFTDTYTMAKQVVIVKDPDAVGKVEAGLSLTEKFYQNFIEDSRWKYIADGLVNTIIITIFAALIGVVLGFLAAIVRSSHDKNGSLAIADKVCRLYLTVIRGTPVMIQLLIIYYVVFASVNINKILVAVIAFGLNSGAYVAEIVRGGIMSIDQGQFEAGRSLGLNFTQTMQSIIMPQAFKNVLPALANEAIVLLKETSICGYIGLTDLTRGGDIIRSTTYEAFMPLVAVALIYLVIVIVLTKLVGKLERRLKSNER
jgi:polar amino acid transport system substrate-binding protein